MKKFLIVITFFLLLSHICEAKYYVEIKANNTVCRVIVAESVEWCQSHFGGRWIETFLDNSNKNFAGIGDNYLEIYDDFCKRQPYPSWILGAHRKWEPPKVMPNDGKNYLWNEKILNWELEVR